MRPSPARTWDLPAAFLLLAALIVAASRLVATEWTDHLNVIQALTFLGVLAGLTLGKSVFSPSLSATFGLVYGLFAVPWQLGLTLGNDILWSDRLIILAGRLVSALGQLARHEAVYDPLLFLFWMSALFWALGAHAGYTLTRRGDVWRATLPTGLVLLIIHISDANVASRAWFVAVYLFLSLLLLARLTYLRHRARWRETRTHVPPFIALDLTRIVLLATALLVLLAWIIPALPHVLPAAREAWQDATDPWRIRIGEDLENLFASLRRAAAVVAVTDSYGESLSLGQGSELTDALILTVQAPHRTATSIRYYWRARVYDHYADGQWSSVAFSTTQSVFPTDLGLIFPELEGRRTVTLTLTPAVPMATFYAAPQPRWVNRPAQADIAFNPDGTADLAVLHATPLLYADETYQARSSLSNVTIAQLRVAGTDYPLWVTSRYLQLPPTITPRTRELARQLAAGLDNPYDIAAGITDFLRTHIHYTETVPPLPTPVAGGGKRRRQEPLDWFLFDLRQGFCDYYASAEVVLLRSLGIPARLAVGFAEGERKARSNTYLVRQRDAHAWPEVYFPGAGWIEFEPTASQPSLYRPPGESQPGAAEGPTPGDVGSAQHDRWEDRLEELLALEDLASEPSTTAAPDSRTPAVLWALPLILSLILITFVWRKRRQRGLPPLPVLLEAGLRRFDLRPPVALRRWALRTTLSPLERAYLELDHALARLNAPPDPAETPAERAAALTRLLPVAADPVQRLLAEYHATTYSPRSGDLRTAQQASRAIRTLSWRSSIQKRADTAFRSLGLRRSLGAGRHHRPR